MAAMCTMPHGLKGHSEALTQRTVRGLFESGAMSSVMGSSRPVLLRRLARVVPYIVMWIC